MSVSPFNSQVLFLTASTHIGGYTTDRPGIGIDRSQVVILYKDGTGEKSNLIFGDQVTLPGNNWSPICSTGSSCYAGTTSHGVSVIHTGF